MEGNRQKKKEAHKIVGKGSRNWAGRNKLSVDEEGKTATNSSLQAERTPEIYLNLWLEMSF